VRAPVAVLLLGVALAVGVPTAWAIGRPGATAASVPAPRVTSVPASPLPPASTAGPPPVTARPAAPPPVGTAVPPVRVQLPGAGIDAPLDPVGVEPDGAMTIPDDVDRVGWYRFGPVPGDQAGTAVLAGHVDDREQGLGALAALRAVEPGEEVRVTDAAGGVIAWRVVSRELVDKQSVPLGELFERSGPPRLALLTCGGEFLPELSSYRDNVVVVAEPMG
jgi:hypothetical protein